MRLTLPLRIGRRLLFWMPNRHKDQPLGERLRLALQELGPVWIKFGQMMSTRRDLFPPHIADQLTLLQDRVAPFDGALARKHIELAMGGPLEAWFDDFDQQPLASASIAQVHTARLKTTGQEVVLKVIRPDIGPIIKADVRLMYRLAGWVPKLLPDGRRLRPREVVREYEKTLLDELNLLREAANAIQLRRNFDGSPMLYVPEVYSDYCRESVLVMERIYGIPVSDIAALEQQNTNMKLLAERGVQVFFTQPQLVLLQKTLLYVEGLGRQLYPQLDLWTTAKPFLESWLRDQVGIPAVVRALKEKAPFWAEKLPELPELFYDSLQQHKLLQQSVDKLTGQMQAQRVRQGQSRYLFGVGATLLVSGTILLLGGVEVFPAWMMAAGVVAWVVGWKRTV
ncbi:hypothetical protein HA402_006796 [Bradysia odoriphaga]|nr:hypothetical protein HA402_006796 [Bradysia odoriphaga]